MHELRYPSAERLDLTENLHGHTVSDPYRWLEEADSSATKEWSEAQDALYTRASAEYGGRERFALHLRALMGSGGVGAPAHVGGRCFFMRRDPDQEHAVLLMAEEDGREHVLIDPGALDPDGLTTLDAWKVDPSGRLLSHQRSEGGDEESVLRVTDIDTGELVDGPIDRGRYSPVAWLPDSSAFYYVRRLPSDQVPQGEEHYHRRVYLHRLGTPAEEDVLIFGQGRDMTDFHLPAISHDGRWLTVTTSRGTSAATEVRLADLEASSPEAPEFVVLQEDDDSALSPHVGRDGRLYLFTDRDAPRGRLCVADPASPGAWTELVPEDTEAVMEDYAILDGPDLARPELLVAWARHAVSEITRHDLSTGEYLGALQMPGLGAISGIVERRDGGHEAWFGYTDTTHPSSVYRYDALAGEVTAWAHAPGEIEVPEVKVEQVTYTSADGTPVRMLVVAPAGEVEGPRPTILYGYGGFRISQPPAFSPTALAWVRSGGVHVVANLRGGLEEGEEWHRDGMLERKQNVFDDCIAAGEHLVATGVTTPEQLSVLGGSNGGLLVGAMVTQRPDLFAAAVCSAPLLDMVRYEHFGLGQLWNVEYGTADDPEQLGWLLGYSPYHNVHEGTRYPATLFTVFDNDTRVDPLHARKLCAQMQWATAAEPQERPVLLRRESEVGHSARSVTRRVSLNSEQLAFLAHHLG